MKYLHVYGQRYEHSTAFIVGNVEGLKELRKLIDTTLKEGMKESELFTYDGEEFTLRVLQFNEANEIVLAKPYVEKTDDKGIWPGELGMKPGK